MPTRRPTPSATAARLRRLSRQADALELKYLAKRLRKVCPAAAAALLGTR